jgi:hypothetical protein
VGTEEEEGEEPALWWIPVTYQHVGEEQAKTTFWLSERSAEMAAPASLADNAFVFNVGEFPEKLKFFAILFYTNKFKRCTFVKQNFLKMIFALFLRIGR